MAALQSRRGSLLPICLAFVLVAGALPLLVQGEFVLFLSTQIAIYFLVALGLNLLCGYGGQISLGHGALFAIGAYATAISMVDYQLSFWIAAPIAIVLTAGAGALMALPAFRLSTWYFALITLGFANVIGGLLAGEPENAGLCDQRRAGRAGRQFHGGPQDGDHAG